MGEKALLLAGLRSQPQQTTTAKSDDATVDAHLVVVLPGIECQPHRDLLAVVECLTGGLLGSDDQEPDLTESELAQVRLGGRGERLL